MHQSNYQTKIHNTFLFSYLLVNCQWSSWQTGQCPKTCGEGTRTNTRTKTVKEKFGGVCSGSSYIMESCFLQKCGYVSGESITDNKENENVGHKEYIPFGPFSSKSSFLLFATLILI